MRRLLIILTLFMLAGVAVWIAVQQQVSTGASLENIAGDEAPSGVAAPGAVRSAGRSAGRSAERGGERRTLEGRDPNPETLSAKGLSGRTTVVLFGLCVDEEDRPVPGMVVRIAVQSEQHGTRQGRLLAKLRPKTVTDSGGRFEIEIPFAPGIVFLRSEAPWRLEARVEFDEDDDFAPRRDVGTLGVGRGFPVAGFVVNPHGEPVSGCWIGVGMDEVLLTAGRFDLGPQEEGEHEFEFSGDFCSLISPQGITVGEGFDTSAIRVVVEENPVVSGVLLDEKGKPVPDRYFEIDVFPDDVVTATTDFEGRFHATTADRMRRFVRCTPVHTLDDDGYIEETPWLQTPRRELVLRLRRTKPFQMRIVDPEGNPAPPCQVLGYRVGFLRRIAAADGVTTWAGLPPGPQQVFVYDKARNLWSDWFDIDPALWTEGPLTVTLKASSRLRVVLDTKIKLRHVATITFQPGPGQRVFPPCVARVLGKVTTLPVPRKIAGTSILVDLGGTHRRSIRLRPEHEQTREVRVRLHAEPVESSGAVVLVAGPSMRRLDMRMLKNHLSLRRLSNGEILRSRVVSQPKIHYPRVFQGSYEVLFRRRSGEPPRSVARVQVEARRSASVHIELPEFAPGRLRGVVTHRGQPLSSQYLDVVSLDGWASRRVSSDAKGRFDARWLLPGRYRLRALRIPVPGVAERRCYSFGPIVQVRSGIEASVRVTTSPKLVRLRVRENGVLAANAWFEVAEFGSVRSDARGVVLLDPPPLGQIRIESVPTPSRPLRKATVDAGRSGVVDVDLRE